MGSIRATKLISSSAGARSYIRKLREAGYTGKTIEHYENSDSKVFQGIDADFRGVIYLYLRTKVYTLARYRMPDYDKFQGNELTYGEFEDLLGINNQIKLYDIY